MCRNRWQTSAGEFPKVQWEVFLRALYVRLQWLYAVTWDCYLNLRRGEDRCNRLLSVKQQGGICEMTQRKEWLHVLHTVLLVEPAWPLTSCRCFCGTFTHTLWCGDWWCDHMRNLQTQFSRCLSKGLQLLWNTCVATVNKGDVSMKIKAGWTLGCRKKKREMFTMQKRSWLHIWKVGLQQPWKVGSCPRRTNETFLLSDFVLCADVCTKCVLLGRNSSQQLH